MTVPDSLDVGLKVVFVGFNPSLRSAEFGFNYAGHSNRFWRILYEAGLTESLCRPEDGPSLLAIGYGFTNIVQRPTRAAAELTSEEYALGRVVLLEKLARYRPRIACYVGKGVYQKAARRNVSWGQQEISIVNGVIDYVTPSSSGLVRMRLEEQVAIYRGVRNLLDELA